MPTARAQSNDKRLCELNVGAEVLVCPGVVGLSFEEVAACILFCSLEPDGGDAKRALAALVGDTVGSGVNVSWDSAAFLCSGVDGIAILDWGDSVETK